MSWSYSGDPASSDLDEVRFWTQDTKQDRQLLSDEDYNYLLDIYMPQYGSIVYTGAVACEVIASRYAHEVSVSADGVSVSVSELQQKYKDLAASLREIYKAGTAGYVSGDFTFEDLITNMEWDWSIPPFVFGMGHMDNYEVGEQEFGGIHSMESPRYYPPGEPGESYP